MRTRQIVWVIEMIIQSGIWAALCVFASRRDDFWLGFWITIVTGMSLLGFWGIQWVRARR